MNHPVTNGFILKANEVRDPSPWTLSAHKATMFFLLLFYF